MNDEEPVRVIREGNTVEVPKCDIVVGDIVMIGTGDDIPADAELLESVQLTVDESTLTGEPLCAKTTVEAEFDDEATFPSQPRLARYESHGRSRYLPRSRRGRCHRKRKGV